MCSTTPWWSPAFLCLCMILTVWQFHRLWPIWIAPIPVSRSTRTPTPRPPKPGTPEMCPACRAADAPLTLGECLHLLTRPAPPPWSEVKGRGGRRKQIDSTGRYCPNPRCDYFAITDPTLHAIVADGHHGPDGSIQNWQCQACGHHASDRFGTFL